MRGLFVTFEGVEGCGKSTQIERLRAYLETRGYVVLVSREPGGPPIAEAIRAILLNPENGAMDAMTEVFLYEAARAQHVCEIIRPALQVGKIVVCDRFADSTTAYQGAGRGLDRAELEKLHRLATGGLQPDCTFLLDLPVALGMGRVGRRGAYDRIEQETRAFHERVRDGFLRLAREDPRRFRIIDADQPIDIVAAVIQGHIDEVLKQRPDLAGHHKP